MTQTQLVTVQFAKMLVKFERLLRQMSAQDAAQLLAMLEDKMGAIFGEVDGKLPPNLPASSGQLQGKLAASSLQLAQNVSSSSSNNGNGRNSALREEALEVLEFLNQKTNRSFRAVDTNLNLIISRLKSGANVADCKAVIARKVRDWGTNSEMNKYLRPETLFAPKKFESYLGEKERDA